MHAGGADGIRKAVGYVLLFMLMALWAREALAQEAAEEPADIADRVAFVIDVQGPIGPATRDFVSRSLETAAEEQAGLLMVFRSHEDISYALVMQANQAIHLFDAVITP